MWKLAVAVATLTACYSANPAVGVPCAADGTCPSGQFCDFAREPPLCVTTPLDAAIDVAVACSPSANTCPADAPVCDDATKTCRRCVQDSDCAGACYESLGTCVDEGIALYVAKDGDDTGTCTRMAPCLTIARALALADDTRSFIVIGPGDYNEGLVASRDTVLSGVSRTMAPMLTRTVLGPALQVQNTATVVVETLAFSSTAGQAISGNNGTTIKVFGVVIAGAQNTAIDSSGGTVEVRQSNFTNNQRGVDIRNNGKKLVVNRSIFSGHNDFALRIETTDYSVTSSLFVDNQRGINIQVTPLATSRFDHNTVVNTSNDFAVRCNNPGPVVSNTIFFGNKTPPVDTGRCTVRYSLVENTLLAGTGNVNGSPGFVSSTDFHLTAQSRAIDAADPQSLEPTDFDGVARPRGTFRDIGAYER